MTWILSKLASLLPFQWYFVGAAGLALVSYGGTQTWRLHTAEAQAATAKAETTAVRGQWSSQVSAAASAAFAASEKYRALEAQMNLKVQESEHARQVDQDASARAAAAFAAERAGLRNQLAAYAAGPASGGGLTLDTLGACHQRAAALGVGLASALQSEEDLTDELERSRADTRSLLRAWPQVAPRTVSESERGDDDSS